MTRVPRIDSHQHFWRLDRGDYGWLTPRLEPLYRDYLPDDLSPLLQDADIHKTVLVQAAPTEEETRFLLELARTTDFVAGVVGWVDMEGEHAVTHLEALAEYPLLLGIRPMIQDISDPNWMLKPELQAMFDKIASLDLAFDALVKPEHLDNLYTLLRRHPNLKVVIDHGAKPDIANNMFQPWAGRIQKLAVSTNACCKLSGLLTEAADDPGYDKVRPYMAHLLRCFGAGRLMWGSDWPVLQLAGDYSGWLALVHEFLSGLSEPEYDCVMGGTANTFYKLGQKNIAVVAEGGV